MAKSKTKKDVSEIGNCLSAMVAAGADRADAVRSIAPSVPAHDLLSVLEPVGEWDRLSQDALDFYGLAGKVIMATHDDPAGAAAWLAEHGVKPLDVIFCLRVVAISVGGA
jgi:hypothetical protein